MIYFAHPSVENGSILHQHFSRLIMLRTLSRRTWNEWECYSIRTKENRTIHCVRTVVQYTVQYMYYSVEYCTCVRQSHKDAKHAQIQWHHRSQGNNILILDSCYASYAWLCVASILYSHMYLYKLRLTFNIYPLYIGYTVRKCYSIQYSRSIYRWYIG